MQLTKSQIQQLQTITETLTTLNELATNVATQLAGEGFDITPASVAGILVAVLNDN
jgi:hypothetical protein